MLLRALHDFYERACRDDLIVDAAFNPKSIRWIVPLDREGNLAGEGLIEATDENGRGKTFNKAPRSSRPKNAGGVAEFLADNLNAVFGIEADPEAVEPNERKRARQAANLKAKQEDFWTQIKQAYEATARDDFAALLSFAEKYNANDAPSFFRWGKSAEPKADEKSCWWVRTASGTESKLAADNFTFQVEGRLLLNDEDVLNYWRNAYTQETSAKDEAAIKGLCLVTGDEEAPIAPTHLPKIAGVPGATSTGALLVSFDKDSFTSYGFDKSYNAPVSSSAVTAYANALNWLLRQKNHTVKIADTALCFWARESDAVTDMMAFLFDTPKPESVRAFLRSPFAGIPNASKLETDDFFSVTLGGNAGRVVVRHWMQLSIEAAVKNLQHWFEDLNIVALREGRSETDTPLSLYRLALATVREAKNLQADTMTQLYSAALEGRAPSLALAAKLIDRFKIDLAREGTDALYNLSRFALLRLILNRHRKEDEPFMTPQLSDTDDAAYNCGRLLAIFDDLQMAAHDYKLEGAGVVERYYGAACSSPNSAFGILWRLHQHHLKKITRQGDAGRAKAEAIKNKIADVATRFRQTDARFPPQFPRAFDLQQQGRFALGFYQQKAFERAARQSYLDAKRNQSSPANEAVLNSTTIQGEATDGQ